MAEIRYATIPAKVGFQLNESYTDKDAQYELDDVVIGDIGLFEYPRKDPWDPFIVVGIPNTGYSPTAFDVIFPRFRINDNGRIEFGCDRTTEKFGRSHKCTCEVHYMGDLSCRCGAEEKDAKNYAETFAPVLSDYKYRVCTIDCVNLGVDFYFPPDLKGILLLPMYSNQCLTCRNNE